MSSCALFVLDAVEHEKLVFGRSGILRPSLPGTSCEALIGGLLRRQNLGLQRGSMIDNVRGRGMDSMMCYAYTYELCVPMRRVWTAS